MARAEVLILSIIGGLSRRFFIVVAMVMLAGVGAHEARAQSVDQIKAAFLFNFARYVEWPSAAFTDRGAAVRICLAASPDFAQVVAQTVVGKSVEERPVEVTILSDLSGASSCHILYVGEGLAADASGVVASVGGASVFTVADRDGFASGGGIANFIRAENKVRFEINPSAAKKAGLKISSRLLRLAKVVD